MKYSKQTIARLIVGSLLANVDFMRLVLFLIPNTTWEAVLLHRIPGIAHQIQEEICLIVVQVPFWKSGLTFRIAGYAIQR